MANPRGKDQVQGNVRPRMRVLLIDDDPHITRSLCTMLRDSADVVAFNEARDALRALVIDSRFDAVICDVVMPELSGTQFAAEATAIAPNIAQRLVFITGNTWLEPFRDRFALRPMLRKPFDVALLHRVLSIIRTTGRMTIAPLALDTVEASRARLRVAVADLVCRLGVVRDEDVALTARQALHDIASVAFLTGFVELGEAASRVLDRLRAQEGRIDVAAEAREFAAFVPVLLPGEVA